MMLQDSELFDLKNPSCFESFIFWLVVTGTVDFSDFPYIGNVIIQTDSYVNSYFSDG